MKKISILFLSIIIFMFTLLLFPARGETAELVYNINNVPFMFFLGDPNIAGTVVNGLLYFDPFTLTLFSPTSITTTANTVSAYTNQTYDTNSTFSSGTDVIELDNNGIVDELKLNFINGAIDEINETQTTGNDVRDTDSGLGIQGTPVTVTLPEPSTYALLGSCLIIGFLVATKHKNKKLQLA